MQSVPAIVPATIVVIFPARLMPIEVPNLTCWTTRSPSLAPWAGRITGTSPAKRYHIYITSKVAWVWAALCNYHICEMPSKLGDASKLGSGSFAKSIVLG